MKTRRHIKSFENSQGKVEHITLNGAAVKMLYRPEIIEQAIIAYHPKNMDEDRILWNESARLVLSPPVVVSEEGHDVFPDVPSLCKKWKKLLDDLLHKEKDCKEEYMSNVLIDKFMSGRRSYSVWGTVLSGCLPCLKGRRDKEPCYTFILNRSIPGGVDLSGVCRKRKLNRRERDAIRLARKTATIRRSGKRWSYFRRT